MWEFIFVLGSFFIKMFTWNSEKKRRRLKRWRDSISKAAGRPVISAKAHDEYENAVDNFDKEPNSDS